MRANFVFLSFLLAAPLAASAAGPSPTLACFVGARALLGNTSMAVALCAGNGNIEAVQCARQARTLTGGNWQQTLELCRNHAALLLHPGAAAAETAAGAPGEPNTAYTAGGTAVLDFTAADRCQSTMTPSGTLVLTCSPK